MALKYLLLCKARIRAFDDGLRLVVDGEQRIKVVVFILLSQNISHL